MLLFSLFILPVLILADPPCPTANISTSGVWPPNAIAPVQLPSDYSCIQNFNIPTGFVIKFTVSAKIPADQSSRPLSIITEAQVYYIENGDTVIYAAGYHAVMVVNTRTDKFSYMVKYDFMDVRNFKKVQKKAGDYLKLNLDPETFYTFSSDNDMISLAAGRVDWKDTTMENTFVFLGPDLSSKFMGSLRDVAANMTKLAKEVSIVNFYGTTGESYIIANDLSKVQKYSTYSVIVTDRRDSAQWTIRSYGTKNVAYTVICDDCTEVYIDQLYFYNRPDGSQEVQTLQFLPSTPQDDKPALLSYYDTDDYNNMLPIQIPAKMFTMVIQQAGVWVQFNPIMKQGWFVPYPWRQITVISPTLWGVDSPAFDYNFVSSFTYNFSVLVESLNINSAGENLQLTIGSFGSIYPCHYQNFSCDGSDVKCDKSYKDYMETGSYAHLRFNAKDPLSSTITHINVIDISTTTTRKAGPAMTTRFVATTPPPTITTSLVGDTTPSSDGATLMSMTTIEEPAPSMVTTPTTTIAKVPLVSNTVSTMSMSTTEDTPITKPTTPPPIKTTLFRTIAPKVHTTYNEATLPVDITTRVPSTVSSAKTSNGANIQMSSMTPMVTTTMPSKMTTVTVPTTTSDVGQLNHFSGIVLIIMFYCLF